MKTPQDSHNDLSAFEEKLAKLPRVSLPDHFREDILRKACPDSPKAKGRLCTPFTLAMVAGWMIILTLKISTPVPPKKSTGNLPNTQERATAFAKWIGSKQQTLALQ